MLKKFFLIVCGSFVGSFLALTIMCLCVFAMSLSVVITMSKASMTKSISDKSILHITLEGTIDERAGQTPVDLMTLLRNDQRTASLDEITKALEVAKTDPKIEGVVVDCNGVTASPTTLRTIRKSILDFKNSKKWVYAYAKQAYDQGDYYVASAADSVFTNPIGVVDVHGFAASVQYYKSVLEKVGVEMQVIRVGEYKSAVEPYMLYDMSPENREQLERYLGSIWNTMEKEMADSRKINVNDFNVLVDSILLTKDTKFLKEHKIIDGTYYAPEFEEFLKKRTGIQHSDDLNYASPEDVATFYEQGSGNDGEIAVVYAVGEIDGTSEDGINSEELVKTIGELQDNEKVKGLVLRVNSPGGSAFGSEQIWKALEDFKKSGKTFAVSMGDYAASGGYYISCGADRIFADSVTVTGSIGIFGVIPCAQDLVENKIGIHTAVVKTNENAEMGGLGILSNKLTPVQLQAMQNMINQGYELFTKRCADGRKMKQDSIKAIGGGHVWVGIDAKANGLIDQFGSLNDAILWVAEKTGLHTGTYVVNSYPSTEMTFEKMFKAYGSVYAENRMKDKMGMFYTYYEKVQAILNRQHVLCIMEPVEIK